MVSLVYTTRDYDLFQFQWAMSAIFILVPICEAKGIFFDVKMAFTGYMCGKKRIKGTIEKKPPMPYPYQCGRPDHRLGVLQSVRNRVTKFISPGSVHSSVKTQQSRFDLNGEIENKATL